MKGKHQRHLLIISLILLFGIVTLFYLPVLIEKYDFHQKQEFTSHAKFADLILKDINSVPVFIIAHPLFAFSEAALMRLIGFSSKTAGIVVSLAAYLWLSYLIFCAFASRLNGYRFSLIFGIFLTVTAMLVAHIPIQIFNDRDIYFGYIGINVYNNATSNFLKPFAFASFFHLLKAFSTKTRSTLYIITAGLLISASTLAKPSFIICFIPAILAYMVVRFLRKEAMDLRLLTFGLFVPAILVLGWQFLINYGGTESQILLMPFAVKSYYSDHLLIKFVFSAFFPTLVLISYLKELIEDPKMVVSWALFAVGSFYSYFLAENSGGGIYHGNFDWSAEISLFLLFATSMIFFFEVKQHHQSIQIKDYIIMGALLLHLASGILFLVFNLTVDSYSYLPSIQRLLWPFLN